MTEAEWLSATDPTPMLESIRRTESHRKLRLLAVACCSPILPLLGCDACNSAIAVAEALADSEADLRAILVARDHIRSEWENYLDAFRYLEAAAAFVLSAIDRHPHQVTYLSAATLASAIAAEDCMEEAAAFSHLSQTQPHLLRDIFGNPFRSVTVDPRWQSETVVSLATGIYAERAFDRMPILADALEEAGCDNADILSHCRSDGPHVRGCWVVDLVLGKE